MRIRPTIIMVAIVTMALSSVSQALDFGPFVDCYKALENHSDNSPVGATSDNFSTSESGDLVMLFGVNQNRLGVFAFNRASGWFFPIPDKKDGDAIIGDQRIVSYRWENGATVAFPQAMIKEEVSGRRTPLTLLKGDQDSSPSPIVARPGGSGIVAFPPGAAAAQLAFSRELRRKIDSVSSFFKQQFEVFGADGAKKSEYEEALHTCESITRDFPERNLSGLKSSIRRQLDLLAGRGQGGVRHRQGEGEHSNGGGPGEVPILDPSGGEQTH